MNILKNRVLSPREEMVLDRLSLLVICKASGEESPPGPPPAATRAMVAAKRIVRIRCPDGEVGVSNQAPSYPWVAGGR